MGPIPAKYFWPGFIVALLGLSITTGVITVYAAKSGGGPQVVADHDMTAQQWNEKRARQRASRKLGWEVEVRPASRDNGTVEAEIELRDASGQPLTDLDGTVELRRPSLAGVQGKAKLESVGDRPGIYRVELRADKPGLWDFDVTARRGDDTFVKTVRKEW